MSGRHADLARLTGMVYRLRQSEMQALRAEEQKLRAALAEMDESRRASARTDHDRPERRAIGADVAWQAWLDARQRTLNMELARLLARKEPVEHRLRQAFGRDRAARELEERAGKTARARHSGQEWQ